MYFDASASTPLHPEVIQTMNAVQHIGGNPYSKHAEGFKAFKVLQKGIDTIANILGVSSDQLVLTHGGTDGNRKVIHELQKRFGAESVWCGNTEHSSVLDEILPSQTFSPDNLQSIPKDTKGLCMMYANNETGRIYDAKGLREKFPEAFILQDWVQGNGKGQSFDPTTCDFATFSAHKFHGPKCVGVLYVKNPEHFPKLSKDTHTKDPVAVTGMAKAFELAQQIDTKQITTWTDQIESFLQTTFPDCIIHESQHDRICGVINVAFKGVRGSELMTKLSHEENVSISTGSACQSDLMSPTHVIKSIQPDPAYQHPIRISLHQFLKDEDIEDLCGILEEYV